MSAEKPLLGATICCTSIFPEDRSRLTQYAEEMGAEHTLDLTSGVTHLLVGDTDSEKYRYVAREREDVKVLKPEWVEALRTKWMAAQPFDLNQLDAEYKCPSFYGLKICITGFDDLNFRTQLQDNVEKNGGQYSGDLTREVTHLVCAAPTGKKYEYAGIWGLKIVSIKWYKDTLDRGMQLNEALYHPTISPEQQGQGAWKRRSSSASKKRTRDVQLVQEVNRKLRRSASSRFSNQHNDLWNDISQNQSPTLPAIPPAVPSPQIAPVAAQNITRYNHDNSEAPPAYSVEHDPTLPIAQAQVETRLAGYLEGKHFLIRAFDAGKTSILHDALAGNGACVHGSSADLQSQSADKFLLVPHQYDPDNLKISAEFRAQIKIVTELWLEWCMTLKAFIEPDQYVFGQLHSPLQVPKASMLSINATGFHQVASVHIVKLIKHLGAQYHQVFTQDTNVLVCCPDNLNPQKLVHARAWKIPIVQEGWLIELMKSGRIPSFKSYQVGSREVPGAGDGETIAARAGDGPAMEARTTSRRKSDPIPIEIAEDDDNGAQRVAEIVKQNEDDMLLAPLQEIVNRPEKPNSPKKKLFRTLENQDTLENANPFVSLAENNPVQPRQPSLQTEQSMETIPDIPLKPKPGNSLLQDFLDIKAATAARRNGITSPTKPKKKKLVGRALSNLSNSSSTSNLDRSYEKLPLSRIGSANSDGLGASLSMHTSNANRSMARPSLKGNATVALSRPMTAVSTTASQTAASKERDQEASFHAALLALSTSQVPTATPRDLNVSDQVGYAESDEAIALRAALAEKKRKARMKAGQTDEANDPQNHTKAAELVTAKNSEQLNSVSKTGQADSFLMDDESFNGGAGRRRTRGQERAHSGVIDLDSLNKEKDALFA